MFFSPSDTAILQGTLRDLSKRNLEHSLTPPEQVCFHLLIIIRLSFTLYGNKSILFFFLLHLMTRLMRAVIIMPWTFGVASLHSITILLMIAKLWYLIVEFSTHRKCKSLTVTFAGL